MDGTLTDVSGRWNKAEATEKQTPPRTGRIHGSHELGVQGSHLPLLCTEGSLLSLGAPVVETHSVHLVPLSPLTRVSTFGWASPVPKALCVEGVTWPSVLFSGHTAQFQHLCPFCCVAPCTGDIIHSHPNGVSFGASSRWLCGSPPVLESRLSRPGLPLVGLEVGGLGPRRSRHAPLLLFLLPYPGVLKDNLGLVSSHVPSPAESRFPFWNPREPGSLGVGQFAGSLLISPCSGRGTQGPESLSDRL